MKKIPEDIRELEEKIARQREKENRLREPAGASEYAGAAGVGLRIAAEFLSAVLVGGAVGYVIDRMVDSRPFFSDSVSVFGRCGRHFERLPSGQSGRRTESE